MPTGEEDSCATESGLTGRFAFSISCGWSLRPDTAAVPSSRDLVLWRGREVDGANFICAEEHATAIIIILENGSEVFRYGIGVIRMQELAFERAEFCRVTGSPSRFAVHPLVFCSVPVRRNVQSTKSIAKFSVRSGLL